MLEIIKKRFGYWIGKIIIIISIIIIYIILELFCIYLSTSDVELSFPLIFYCLLL